MQQWSVCPITTFLLLPDDEWVGAWTKFCSYSSRHHELLMGGMKVKSRSCLTNMKQAKKDSKVQELPKLKSA